MILKNGLVNNLNSIALITMKQNSNKQSTEEQENNPLHGITLERIVKELVDHFGWEELGFRININRF